MAARGIHSLKATVTITGINNYKGTIQKTFKINPKGTTLKTPVAASKAITVKWTKQSTKMNTSRITGYQIAGHEQQVHSQQEDGDYFWLQQSFEKDHWVESEEEVLYSHPHL